MGHTGNSAGGLWESFPWSQDNMSENEGSPFLCMMLSTVCDF